MKKRVCLALALMLLAGLLGCAGEEQAPASDSQPSQNSTVGICLPEETAYWTQQAQVLGQGLKNHGCEVLLRYAGQDAWVQEEQIQELVQGNVGCLVIAAVDSAVLTQVQQQAKDAGIPVIAYERLLMDTDAVSYYIGFDNRAVGQAVANAIVRERALDTALKEERSYTVEFFMGTPEDNNALMLYDGVMQVLGPYLENGVLVCKTGRVAFEDVCVAGWSGEEAERRCLLALEQTYGQERPDILCALSDGLANGCIQALEQVGCAIPDWPLVTGCGAEMVGVENLLAGRQALTVYRNPEELAQQCAQMVAAVLSGEQPQVNDSQSCYNNMGTVPAYLWGFELVDSGNYRQVLAQVYTPQELEQARPT